MTDGFWRQHLLDRNRDNIGTMVMSNPCYDYSPSYPFSRCSSTHNGEGRTMTSYPIMSNHSLYFLTDLNIPPDQHIRMIEYECEYVESPDRKKVKVTCQVEPEERTVLLSLSVELFDLLRTNSELASNLLEMKSEEEPLHLVIANSICQHIVEQMEDHPLHGSLNSVPVGPYQTVLGALLGYLRLLIYPKPDLIPRYSPELYDSLRGPMLSQKPNQDLLAPDSTLIADKEYWDSLEDPAKILPGFDFGEGRGYFPLPLGDFKRYRIRDSEPAMLFSPSEYFQWFFHIANYMGDEKTLERVSQMFILEPFYEPLHLGAEHNVHRKDIVSFYRTVLPHSFLEAWKYLNSQVKELSISKIFQRHLHKFYYNNRKEDKRELDILLRKKVSEDLWDFLYDYGVKEKEDTESSCVVTVNLNNPPRFYSTGISCDLPPN